MKRNSIFAVIGIYIAVLFSCSGSKEGRNGTDPDKGMPDTLKVAMQLSPMTLTLNGDSMSGFSYELLRMVCDSNRQKYEIVPFTVLGEAIEASRNGTVHIVVTNEPVTSHINEFFITTTPLYIDRQILVQNKGLLKDSIIKSQQELAGKTIYITNNLALSERLNNLSDEIGAPIGIIVIDSITEEELLMKVGSGEIRYAAASRLSVQPDIIDSLELDISTDLSLNQIRSWLLNPHDSLIRDSIDVWLKNAKTTKEYGKLAKKYGLK